MRVLKSRSDRTTSHRIATINLRAYPAPPGTQVTSPDALRTEIFGKTIDARQENRRRFGRSLSMDRIEAALTAAYRGSMQDITDILHETVDTDPHLGSILNKRFGALAALPYEVQPANGVGIDRERAMFYAEVVRIQLRNLKSFRRNISQLAWGLFNGRACLEKNWIELRPGSGPVHERFGQPVLAVSDMDWIHPRRLSFGPQRELRIQPENMTGMLGSFPSTGISVLDMPDKFIWWLPQLFNEYPEREGLGMRCMYWSFFKRYAARERMILTELYGKPWRIVEVESDSPAGGDELKDADQIADQLGATHTARMPRGTKLKVETPSAGAGSIHSDVIKESDQQNSKLVLGQTGTTDGVPSGLNNNQANVMQDEQLGVLLRDAGMLSEVFESMLTDRIIALNFGEDAVTHAPTFKLRADLPADRKAELDRLKAALDSGLSIARQEAYEISGFGMPEDSDVIIRLEQPPTPPNSPVAPAVRPVFVFPAGATPNVGEQQLPPPPAGYEAESETMPSTAVSVTDARNTVTVNEDRSARGLGPLMLPDGTEDPRGHLIVSEFVAQIEAQIERAKATGTSTSSPSSVTDAVDEAASVVEAALGIAASKRRLVRNVVADIEEGDTPYGEGGVHAHGVNRAMQATALDGAHLHVFKIGGQYIMTSFDGAHMHGLAAADSSETMNDGEHAHSIQIDANSVALLTMEDGPHVHELQVSTTAVDGSHTHLLRIADPSNPAGYSEYRSMTSAELAADVQSGSIPDDLFEMVDEEALESTLPYLVTTTQKTLDELKRSSELHRIFLEHKQPTTANGSPEDLVTRGIRELASQTSAWATAFEAAVGDAHTSFAIYNALAKARTNLSTVKFGLSLTRHKTHAMMLGVLDSVKEVASLDDDATEKTVESVTDTTSEIGQTLKQVGLSKRTLSTIVLAPKGSFSRMPYKQALKWFRGLNVLDRASFERASAHIRQRSFTVAGVLGDQMLHVLQADLFKSIKEGEDLRKFKARIRPRLQEAGFVAQLGELKDGKRALNASHVETVFRTNTLNTYNTGRYVHQSSPSVAASFPVWEIRAVKDTRTRETHAKIDGVMLLANDEFWQKAYPPFGFNCRCRVIPRTRKYLEKVRNSSSISDIPDSGFTSGKTALALG